MYKRKNENEIDLFSEFFTEIQNMACLLHHLKAREFLKFPLVVQNEAVSTWPPSLEILFSTYILRRSIEDSALTALDT
jgi:hypothetical protein